MGQHIVPVCKRRARNRIRRDVESAKSPAQQVDSQSGNGHYQNGRREQESFEYPHVVSKSIRFARRRRLSCGRRRDQPDIADTKTKESAEAQGLVPRVLEHGIGMRVIRMVQMMLVVQGQQDHEKDSVDDAHCHQE